MIELDLKVLVIAGANGVLKYEVGDGLNSGLEEVKSTRNEGLTDINKLSDS